MNKTKAPMRKFPSEPKPVAVAVHAALAVPSPAKRAILKAGPGRPAKAK